MKCVKFDNIYVCGCCTDICVYNFVNSLNNYLLKNYLDTNIIVVEDAVDTFNGQKHNADEVNFKYLSEMNCKGISMTEYNDKLFQKPEEEDLSEQDYEDYLEELAIDY